MQYAACLHATISDHLVQLEMISNSCSFKLMQDLLVKLCLSSLKSSLKISQTNTNTRLLAEVQATLFGSRGKVKDLSRFTNFLPIFPLPTAGWAPSVHAPQMPSINAQDCVIADAQCDPLQNPNSKKKKKKKIKTTLSCAYEFVTNAG